MKIFLSAIENTTSSKNAGVINMAEYLVDRGIKMKWNLMSYYYIRKRKELAEFIRDNSEEILIDSGAHSFQKGTKVDWDEYTKEYANFITKFDRPNVIGYFEMDVDNIIGYQKVLEYGDIRLAEWAGINEEEWREQKLKTKGDIEYEDERVNYQSY